jgi:protein-disulfide isomerase
MFKQFILPAALLGSLVACQPPAAGGNKELVERIEKLEKKVEALEKRPAGPAPQQPPPPQTAAYAIPSGDSPVLGNKDAKIELTIFSDYECPFCGRVDPMLHEVTKDADLKDKVKVVYKHFPLSFHKNAKPAAKAAMAARDVGGDKAFWDFSEKAYQNQKDLTAENFIKWAEASGVSKAKFEKALKDNDAKYEEAIKKDMDLGSSAAKVRGTPSLFVNGWELRQRSVDGVKQIIKEKNLG